jgi:hypothetical protein
MVMYEMMKLSISWTRFETNYQVVVQVGTVKIYVAAAEVLLRTKERGDETQFTTKIGGKN